MAKSDLVRAIDQDLLLERSSVYSLVFFKSRGEIIVTELFYQEIKMVILYETLRLIFSFQKSTKTITHTMCPLKLDAHYI